MNETHARIKLTFPEHLITQPVLARMMRRFDVEPNIRQANVEEKIGWIVCELGGFGEFFSGGLRDFFKDLLDDVAGGERAEGVEGPGGGTRCGGSSRRCRPPRAVVRPG